MSREAEAAADLVEDVRHAFDELWGAGFRGAELFYEVLPRLRELGITSVRAEFNGRGDIGCVQDVWITPVHGEVFIAFFHGRISEAVCSLLPPGWDSHHGAFGEVELLVDDASLTLLINERVMRSRASTATWTLQGDSIQHSGRVSMVADRITELEAAIRNYTESERHRAGNAPVVPPPTPHKRVRRLNI